MGSDLRPPPERRASISQTGPFSEFASVYDDFMHYVDYEGWVNYVCEILNFYRIKGIKLLDLACGTGKCAILFAQRGFEVIGIDISNEMLAQALNKIETKKFNIKFLCQDMRNFGLDSKVDIVTCLYDSFNYLLEKDDLEKTFINVNTALDEGGIFVFDMNTKYALEELWGSRTLQRNERGISSVWKSEYDPDTHIGTLHLTWTMKENGRKKKCCEIHRETFYENDEIRNLLKNAGFKEVVIYAHGTFQAPVEVTPRIMVVALKGI